MPADPAFSGELSRIKSTGLVVNNDKGPAIANVAIRLNEATVFFNMQGDQIKKPAPGSKVYVWVWLENCAANPSSYPAAAVVVAPWNRRGP